VLDDRPFRVPTAQLLNNYYNALRTRCRILEVRTGNPDGSEWVTSYTYHSDDVSQNRIRKVTPPPV